jgi:hypothetical protein
VACCKLTHESQHTSAYVSIRQHTSAHVSIRQHTSAYVSIRQHTYAACCELTHKSQLFVRLSPFCQLFVSAFCALLLTKSQLTHKSAQKADQKLTFCALVTPPPPPTTTTTCLLDGPDMLHTCTHTHTHTRNVSDMLHTHTHTHTLMRRVCVCVCVCVCARARVFVSVIYSAGVQGPKQFMCGSIARVTWLMPFTAIYLVFFLFLCRYTSIFLT